MDSERKILDAALKVFVSMGFDGASTAKIAKEAGVSNGTFFHCFRTKEDLIGKLYITLKQNYKNYLLEHMEPSETVKGKIRQLWLCCVKWYFENGAGVTFFTMFSNSPHIDSLSRDEASRKFTFLYDLFGKAIDEEIIIDVDIDLILYYFDSSVRAFTNFVAGDQDRFAKYEDIAFRMLWRSVANI